MNSNKKPIVIDTSKYNTTKVQALLRALLPDNKGFDANAYAEVWLKCYAEFKKSKLTLEELAMIGSLLQIRKLPKREGLGALNKHNLFELFEYCNDLIYKLATNQLKGNLAQERSRIIHYSVELMRMINEENK